MAQMNEVPVVHAAVVGGILAHGGDHDAVRQRDAAELDRREELRVRQLRFLSREKLCGSPWPKARPRADPRAGTAGPQPPARACPRGLSRSPLPPSRTPAQLLFWRPRS